MSPMALPPQGIITVMNTPFKRDLAVDAASFRRGVRYAVDAGVAGMLVPAMASEVSKLTRAERFQLVEIALEECGGRVPVIGGASTPAGGDRVEIARALVDAGCPGVLVSIPYREEMQYRAAVADVARVDPGFLMIQDWDFTGYGIPVPVIQDLFAEHDCFRALKVEVVPAGVKYSQVKAATGGVLHVSGGWAVMQMIEALDRGVDAFMPTGMHEIYGHIHADYHAGRRPEAQRLFNRLLPVLAFSNQHLDISVHFYKRLLHQQGIYETPRVRDPIRPFDEVHERLARELVARVEALRAEVGAVPLEF